MPTPRRAPGSEPCSGGHRRDEGRLPTQLLPSNLYPLEETDTQLQLHDEVVHDEVSREAWYVVGQQRKQAAVHTLGGRDARERWWLSADWAQHRCSAFQKWTISVKSSYCYFIFLV